MKFKVINFGCKVNTYESTFLEEKLLSKGFIEASSIEDANIILINTCSVTNMADQKCKKQIRRIRRENKEAILVVCGCSVQNNFEEYQKYGINILLGNYKKSLIPDLIDKYLETRENIEILDLNRNQEFDNMNINRFTKHTRAFIKIQDGCDNFCSYCVIPLLRGSIRSKNFISALEEATNLAKNGHKEIVLVGIHTGSYNSSGKDLSDLIDEISKIDEVKRIRLSSVEITELNDKFMNLLKTNDKLVNHLHIPLQSGSDDVLKLMNRKYDLSYYENKIDEIRMIRPDINITTDVIVGHPGETEENFNECLSFCSKIKFGKIHVFPYSVRNNTKASLMDNHVKEEDKKIRSNKLIRLSNLMQTEYEEKFIGKNLDIITEINHQNEIVGFTSNYIKVLVSNSANLKQNELVSVKLEKREDDFIYASINEIK